MARFDYSGAAPDGLAGWTAFVVKSAEETTSKSSGNAMIAVRLEAVNCGTEVRDWIMLEGKGAKRPGSYKVKAILGMSEPPADGYDVDPDELVGRKVWGYVIKEKSGKYLNDKIDAWAKESDGGYLYAGSMKWPGAGEPSSVGGDVALSQEEADDADFDSIPFSFVLWLIPFLGMMGA